MTLETLPTPALVLDLPRMQRNIARLRDRLAAAGVAFRAHLKTAKSVAVAERLMTTPRGPGTVSTLREAEVFFAAGVTDLTYAVGIAPAKLDRVASLRAAGCDLGIILDSVAAAEAVRAFSERTGARFAVLLEVDTDGHRSGLAPESPLLLETAAALGPRTELRGVLTHGGGSYAATSPAAIVAAAERERAGAVTAAERLRAAGFAAPVVSVGSTPTAHFAARYEGVTEVRAGVHVFQDLVMHGLGVCALDDIAISVLATVIGHQPSKGWLVTDAGWMALSRDRGTATQAVDRGYGVVTDLDGVPIAGLQMTGANQEHGLLARTDGGPLDLATYPVGTRLRILPNHACATAAQHPAYAVVHGTRTVAEQWERFGGW